MKRLSPSKWTIDFCGALALWLLTGTAHAWVTAEPPVAPPAGTVTVTGKHFRPDSPVEVFLRWKRCSVTADAKGQFACTFKVPKSLEPGARNIWTVNRANGRWIRTPFTVQSLSGRTDWSNEAFDVGRTRYNPYETLLGPANVSQLKRLWTASGTLQIVTGGKVFVKPADFNGIQALNETTGTEAWRVAADLVSGLDGRYSLNSSLGQVYAASSVREFEGDYAGLLRTEIQAFSTQLGTQSWASELFHNENGARVNVVSSADTPNHIYFSYLHRLDAYYPGNGTLGTSDGSQIWHMPGGPYSRASLRHAPELAAGSFIYQSEGLDLGDHGSFGNSVIDSRDGAVTHSESRFCFNFQPGGCFCEGASGDLCPPIPTYVNAGYGLVVQSGSPVDGWQPEEMHAPLIVSRVDVGTLLWSLAPPVGVTFGVSALTPDRLYIGSSASTEASLHAIKAHTGEVLWSRVIAGNATIQPTVANGVVYLGNRAYDARNGDLLWTNLDLVDTVSPIVVNGRLYANQTDGNVSAWGLD